MGRHHHHKSKVEDYGNVVYYPLDQKIPKDHKSNIVGYLYQKPDPSPQRPLLEVMLANQRILSSLGEKLFSPIGTLQDLPDASMIQQLFNQLQDPVLATASANRIVQLIYQFKDVLANNGCIDEWRAMVNSAQAEPLLQQNPYIVKRDDRFNFFKPMPVEQLSHREMFRRAFSPF